MDKYAADYIAASSTQQVTIAGFASQEGDAAHNNQLSNQRAQAVSDYLAGKGIAAASLTVQALGGTDQFSTSDPRANRRATLTPRSPGGTGPAVSPPPAPPVELTHQTEASAPSNRQRTTIGVGERVTLSVKPGPGAWLISGRGKLSSGRGSTVTLIAGDTAGNVDVSVNVAGQTAAIRFQVIAPRTVTMEVIGTRHDPALGPNGGIHTRTFIGPDNVSFANVAVLELEIAPSSKSGIFSFATGHGPNRNPIGSTATVTSGKGTLSRFQDNAAIAVPPQTGSLQGTCIFNIPWQYSVNGGTQHNFATVVQSMVSDAAGTVTVIKDATPPTAFPLGGTASTYPGAPY